MKVREPAAAPLCQCGCGCEVKWDRGRARWRPYASVQCYRGCKSYHDPRWLHQQYVECRRSAPDIAAECGVGKTSILKALRKHDIPRRHISEALIGVQTGAKNPAWKGGIAKWAYAPEWKRIARSVRQRAQHMCQRCGASRVGPSLHVHHIDRDKFNNELANLVALCAPCHRKVEYDGAAGGDTTTPCASC